MADEESLVSRRPRRSTAGNRMELALAELALEEPQAPEEDIDFIVDKEEEDVFESDFASTDEEAAQEGVEEGDGAMREEERRERKTARARVEKATAAAHARQRVTFNPGATSSQPKSQLTPKTKRRVSLGVVVNAETGEVIEGGAGTAGVKRQSQRRHTIMNTSATVNRMKDAEEKRAAIPKKTKTTTRLPTQDELIAQALDTEEGNTTEHRNYLRLEEEKRAKARVVKRSVEGPVLRWISKKETIQVEVQLPSLPPLTGTTTSANLYTGKYSFVYSSGIGTGTVGSQAYSMPFYAYTPLAAQSAGSKPQEASTLANGSSSYSSGNPPVSSASTSTTPTSLTSHLPSTSSSNMQDHPAPPVCTDSSIPLASSCQQQPQQPQTQLQAQSSAQPSAQTQAQTSTQRQPPPILFSYPPVSTTPLIAHRTENVCKNYVVHELSQSIPSKPPWKDTMSAMFGEHVQWDQVKVFTGKGRPLARPIRPCPITGQPAKYCDPRTNVPFADVGTYNVLTRVLGREYMWCSALGCYVGVGETGRRDMGSGGDAEGRGKADVASKPGEGSGADGDGDGGVDGDREGEELDERDTKRRRVATAEG